MQPFSPNTEGKEWCEQCELRKTATAAHACRSPFCKLKALLPADEGEGFAEDPQPIAPPIDVDPEIIARVERARAQPKVSVMITQKNSRQRDKDGLTAKARALLTQMEKHAAPDGTVSISFNDVFRTLGCSAASSVSPLMQCLIERRFVSILERKGGRTKTRYLIHGLAQDLPLEVPPGEPIEQLADEAPPGEPPAHIVGERTIEIDEVVEPPKPETRVIAGILVRIIPKQCGTCRFSHCVSIGRMVCRRMPPHPRHNHPCIKSDGWCGEYQKAQKST